LQIVPRQPDRKATGLCVACLIAFATSQIAHADGFLSQFVDPEDGHFDASSYLAENAYGFLPVPIIITDPAVDDGLGVVGLVFHETDEQQLQRLEALRNSDGGVEHLLTPSVSAIGGAVTGNDSWFAGGGHMGFFRQGRIRYSGGAGYGTVNLDFFGFGGVRLTRPIELKTKAAAIVQNLKFKLGELPIFIGPTQRYVSAQISPMNLGDLSGDFLPPELQERWQALVTERLTQDAVTSGVGISLEFDSRDNFFSPHSGYHYKVDYLWYRDAFGSDFDYQLASFSGRNHWKVTDSFRAALRLDLEHADTANLLPPFATPSINLRGVPSARYQGNSVAVTEAEVTWQINQRWSLLGFAGAGRAGNSFDDLKDGQTRVAKGAGFRYLIARRYGFEMGLDIAVGPEDTVVYVQAGSAW